MKNEYCDLTQEILLGSDEWVNRMAKLALARENMTIIQKVIRIIQLKKNFNLQVNIAVDQIIDYMEMAENDLEIFHFSYLLQNQKFNLSQLMKLQKRYIDLQQPELNGYYLAQVLNKNRLIMPFLVDLKEQYFQRLYETSKMSGKTLVTFEIRKLIN